MKETHACRRAVRAALPALLLLGTLSCARSAADPGVIRVGVITSLSGQEAPFGDKHRKGYTLALEEINQKGVRGGKKIQLLYEDDISKPESAIAAIDRLANHPGVVGVLGAYSSVCTYPMAKRANDYKVPLVSPTATTESLTKAGYDYVFRINSSTSVYADSLIRMALDLSGGAVRTLAILNEDTEFGKDTAESSKKVAAENRLRVVLHEEYSKGEVDFKAILSKIKAVRPDILIMVAYRTDAVKIANDIAHLGVTAQALMGAGAGFSVHDFIKGTGRNSEYYFNVNQWSLDSPYPGSQEYAQKYKERYRETAQYHSIQAYSALKVMADAIDRAEVLDREHLRRALAATDRMTPFGPVRFEHFDGHRNQNRHGVIVEQVLDGRLTAVYPKEAARARPVYPYRPPE